MSLDLKEREPYIFSLDGEPARIALKRPAPLPPLDLDIVEAQLVFERLSQNSGNAEAFCSAIVAWFQESLGVAITVTQAWDLIAVVRTAFDAHKKKLLDSLTSHFGSTLIPSVYLEKKDQEPSISYTAKSHGSLPAT